MRVLYNIDNEFLNEHQRFTTRPFDILTESK